MPGADTRAHLPGAAMLDPHAYVEAAAFIAACALVGGLLGLLVSEMRDGKGVRHGH